MAVSKSNQTVSVTLSKETINQLEEIAKLEDRPRGYIIAKIVEENIEKYMKKIKE